MSTNKNPVKYLKGELYIFCAAIFGSLLPVFSNPQSSPLSPFWIVAISSLISNFIFLIIFIKRQRFAELLNKSAVYLSCQAGLLIGIIYTGLVYVGTYKTSPQNASIIVTFDVLTAMLLLRRISSEKISKREIIGGFLMLFSGVILFMPSSFNPNTGDIILFLACFITPLGNLAMKKARQLISSETILLIRTTISSPCLLLIAYFIEGLPYLQNLENSVYILLLNGILVLALSKFLFIEGINLIPISKASSIISISPLLTFIFAALFLNQLPQANQLLAIVPCMIGLLLLLNKNKTCEIAAHD